MATKKHFHADGARARGIQHGSTKAPDSGWKGYKVDGAFTTPKAKAKAKPVKAASKKSESTFDQLA